MPFSTVLPDAPPRVVTTERTVLLVLVGGFLGAGKTTALTALAKEFTERGLRVGIVTNDQAAHLVDTATVRQVGFVASEVAGGCFCCQFTDFVEAAQQMISEVQPDVLLCEPVGSCTDMAATVIAPLRHFYPQQFAVAPFSVLVDPKRVKELVLGGTPGLLAAEAAYIFDKQLEEADEIVLNKIDRLSEEDTEHLSSILSEKFGRAVRSLSAVRGDGIAAWADRLSGGFDKSAGIHRLREIDYDTYATGEAVLGWLNATAEIAPSGGTPIDPERFLQEVFASIKAVYAADPAEIAHIKLALSDTDGNFLRANLTTDSGQPEFSGGSSWQIASTAKLVVNARVQSAPEQLERVVREALEYAATRTNAICHVDTLQCFQPGYPRPPYRIAANA